MSGEWREIRPAFAARQSAGIFIENARYLSRKEAATSPDRLQRALDRSLALSSTWPRRDAQAMRCSLRLLADLLASGWTVRVRSGRAFACAPAMNGDSVAAEKERIRRQELRKRNEQLTLESVAKFITSMERHREHGNAFVSIFSLMRDGDDLAAGLRKLRQLPEIGIDDVRAVIDPYVQFVDSASRCEFTGLRLVDVWRYFRHTWATQYQSVPGRTLSFLVRDAAAPSHPVIGIGSLSSPVVGLRDRDSWIGWDPQGFIDHLARKRAHSIRHWIENTLERALLGVFTEDLIASGLITVRDLRHPTKTVVDRLRRFAAKERRLHHRFQRSSTLKGNRADVLSDDHWKDRAATHLFRSKRATLLAGLLAVRMSVEPILSGSSRDLRVFLKSAEGKSALSVLLRKVKADRVGTAVADISVCGAVAPYSHLLGGKLVAMLATTPLVVTTYRDRYAAAASEIASAMAGKTVIRPSDLAVLTTSSLYGVGSSQYNRLRIPGEVAGSSHPGIRFERLGMSESFGTSQFSESTVRDLVILAEQSHAGQRVNSIFGEGASPRLRKVRQGLDLLGIPADVFLRHGRQRIIYGVALIDNLLDYLVGVEARPRYRLSMKNPQKVTRTVIDWWITRWLVPRIQSSDVIDAASRHSLVHPIQHGARVTLPEEAR